MTNKYAIYCDSLEDEQLLKNWIKKEFKSDFYNSDKFQKKKLFFGFPNYHNYQGFLEGQHTSSFISNRLKDYIEINIKDFLKEYYMKELPKQWVVWNDGSQLFKDTVVHYLNTHYSAEFKGWVKDSWYGVIANQKYQADILVSDPVKITIQEFIKLTTKNMKTELLGLPVIRGEKHHLEAFLKDCEKFGHNGYIAKSKEKESLTLIYNNYDEQTILKNDEAFKTLFVGRIERGPIYNSGTKAKIFQYNLPQDWSKALDFMKENMDRWLKIQEESKEPEYKVGDWVYAERCGSDYRKDKHVPLFQVGEVYKSFPTDTRIWLRPEEGKSDGIEITNCRKATPEEIEEYNNPFKVGDYVLMTNLITGCTGVEGRVGLVINNNCVVSNGLCATDEIQLKVQVDGQTWAVAGKFTKVTAEDFYKDNTKIFKMTSTSGDFELEVSKKGIYYRPENKWLEPYHIKSIIEPCEQNYISISGDDCYSFQFETVKVGCKAGIPISCWKQVYDYYKSITQ